MVFIASLSDRVAGTNLKRYGCITLCHSVEAELDLILQSFFVGYSPA